MEGINMLPEKTKTALLYLSDKFDELMPSTNTGKKIIALFTLYIIAPALHAAVIGLWLWLFSIIAINF